MVKVLYVYGDHLTLQAKKNLRSWVTHDFFRGTKENLLFGYSNAPRGREPRGALWFFSIFRQSKQIIGAHAERRGNEDDVLRRRDALSVLP